MDNQVLSIFPEAPKSEAAAWQQGSVSKPTGRLFSATQVAVATFLGSPLAGSLLFARNYQVLGKNGAALKALALGVVATGLLILLVTLLPKGMPLALLSIVGMRAAVGHYQGRAISDHEYRGGPKGSWLVAIAVGLASFVLVLGVFFVLVFVFVAVSAIS